MKNFLYHLVKSLVLGALVIIGVMLFMNGLNMTASLVGLLGFFIAIRA